MKLIRCDDCGDMVAEDQFYIAGEQCIECAKAQEEDAIRGDEGHFTLPAAEEGAEDEK